MKKVCLILLFLSLAPVTAMGAAARPAAAKTMSADEAYDAIFHWLSAGKQQEMERVLFEAVQAYDDDPRIVFFAATCVRSRFMVEESAPLFRRVVQIDRGNGPYGRAAQLVLDLDARRDVSRNLAALMTLIGEHPDDPMLLWTGGIICRTFDANRLGAKCYQRLLKQLNPGPVLVHQTYANLLDELDRSAEAVPHRKLAVELEPASWSYQGLGNTQTRLGRWDEADAAFERCTALAPTNARYWMNWAWSKYKRGDDAGSIALCRRGLAVNPKHVTLWNIWGDCELRLGNANAALPKYTRAIELAPRGYYAYRQSAAALTMLGEAAKAREFTARADALENRATASASE